MRTLHADLTSKQQASSGLPAGRIRFYSKDGVTSLTYLTPIFDIIPNNGWELGLADYGSGNTGGWVMPSSQAAVVSTGTPRTGSFHLKMPKPGAGQDPGTLTWSCPFFELLKGQKIRLNCYNKLEQINPPNVPATRYFRVNDGVGTTEATLSTSATYALVTSAIHTVSLSATQLVFTIVVSGGNAAYNLYIDDMYIEILDADDNVIYTDVDDSAITGRVIGIRAAEGFSGGSLYNITGPDGRTIPIALEIKMSNADLLFNTLDIRGYKAVVDWGFLTDSGIRYSAGEPYWIVAQRNESREGELFTTVMGMSVWQRIEYKKVIGESTGALYGSVARVPRQVLLDTLMTLMDSVFSYDATQSGAITAFADYSATVPGTVLVTSAAHLLATGRTVTISGTTNYDGAYSVTVVDANTFYITHAWLGDDATGLWTEAGVYTDETADAQSDALNDVTLLPADPHVNDAVYVGDDAVFDAVSTWISTAGVKGTQTITLVKEYYTGTAWAALTTEYDSIGDFTTAGLKTLKFTKPTDWATVAVNGTTRYWMRWRVSAASGGAWTTAPLGARVSIQDGWGFEVSLSDGIEDTYSQTISGITYDTPNKTVIEQALARTQSALIMTEYYFKLFDYDLTPATDYTYRILGGHTFFDSRFEQGLVIPNRVVATDLNPITGTFNWSGTANNAASQGVVGIVLEFVVDAGITSNAIAANVATQRLNRLIEAAFSGYIIAPMNCGQEVWDYVEVIDSRATKTWYGRVGHIVREWMADTGLYRIILDLGAQRLPTYNFTVFEHVDALADTEFGGVVNPPGAIRRLFEQQNIREEQARLDAEGLSRITPHTRDVLDLPPREVRRAPSVQFQPEPSFAQAIAELLRREPPKPVTIAIPTPTNVLPPKPPEVVSIAPHTIEVLSKVELPGETSQQTAERLRNEAAMAREVVGMTADEIIARNNAILNAKPKTSWWRRIF